jgi:3-hydroxyacyl-CoA dehydrogenase
VLSGGDTDIIDTVNEQQLLDLERKSFMALVRQNNTLARVEHTLETGKPLRN